MKKDRSAASRRARLAVAKKGVFISHAEKDRTLAESLVDLLVGGVGLPVKEVFCTSLEGMGVPKGVPFVKFIRDELRAAELVIPVLTQNYYESVFCLCELGATWVIAKDIHPLLVPPLTYQDVQAVLTGVQLGSISSEAQLSDLRDDVACRYGLDGATARWEMKKRKFLKDLPGILEALPSPERVSYAEHKHLEAQYEDAIEEMGRMDDELNRRENTIEQLKKVKDAKRAARVVRENSPEWEQLEQLAEDALKHLNVLPRVAVEALFYSWYGRDLVPGPGQDDKWREAEAAAERGYVEIDEENGSVAAVSDDEGMGRASAALDELDAFLGEASPGLIKEYKAQNGFRLEMTNRKFWEKELGLLQ